MFKTLWRNAKSNHFPLFILRYLLFVFHDIYYWDQNKLKMLNLVSIVVHETQTAILYGHFDPFIKDLNCTYQDEHFGEKSFEYLD